jgi:hypothetical protein
MGKSCNFVRGVAVLVLFAAAASLQPDLYALSSAARQNGVRDLDVAGKAISALPPDPRIAAAIESISPKAVRADIAMLVTFKNRSTLSSMTPHLPPGTGAPAAANWIFDQYTAISKACGGCLEVKRDTFTQPVGSRIPTPTTLTNVYAILKGTDPAQSNRTVLVTGHYDSRVNDVLNTANPAPGANDDASGVAVSIESARALSKLHFPATIIFASVDGEEQGLYGSRHLAALLKSENVNLEAVLNNDIVGGNTTPGDKFQDKQAVRVFSQGIPGDATPKQLRMIEMLGYAGDSPSRELARAITGVDATYFGPGDGHSAGHSAAPYAGIGVNERYFHPVLEFRLDRFLRGGDHYSFNQEGFAAVRFTEWREDFNHQHQDVRVENGVQYGDLIRFVDMHYVVKVAELNAATLATLASAPPPPVEVKIVAGNLDNNSTLRWQPGPGARAGTRYQIVWRELAAPDWQFVADASEYIDKSGAGDSVTLPVAKDNVIFGVRAVDAAGHASYAVPPYPVR